MALSAPRSPGPLLDIAQAALEGLEVEVLEEIPLQFSCPCSRSRVEMSVRLLGAAALLYLLAEVLVTARVPVLRLARGAAVARAAARAPRRVVRDGLRTPSTGR